MRRLGALGALVVLFVACSSKDDEGGDACSVPEDQDGIIGGDTSFEVNVSDTEFAPRVLKAQNSANITLKVTNTGTKPHGLTVECLVVNGCSSCFPEAAKVAPLAPGEAITVRFVAPEVEGIYSVVSDGDSFAGQFILQ